MAKKSEMQDLDDDESDGTDDEFGEFGSHYKQKEDHVKIEIILINKLINKIYQSWNNCCLQNSLIVSHFLMLNNSETAP